MKVIILAAGQGTRLRPLTDDRPKCMVEIKGKSIVQRQVETMKAVGIKEEDIYIVTGYRGDQLRKYFSDTRVNFFENVDFETTNMVCSLMCARSIMENDVLISYGDIVYTKEVLENILNQGEEMAVVTDDGWYDYWSMRCENPLDDAETLIRDEQGYLIEIGQKTTDINKVQSQYIGLIRFQGKGVEQVLNLNDEAKRRSQNGIALWRTNRNYNKMYMTDLLQGLIDEGCSLKGITINRGWFEVDCQEDLAIAEKFINF